MSYIDQTLEKLDPRYSLQLEYGGWEGKKPVLRFCGDVIGDYVDFPAAIEAAEKHSAKSSWRLMVKNGSVLWLARNGVNRIAYGADVREYSDEFEAAARFGYCVFHEYECNS